MEIPLKHKTQTKDKYRQLSGSVWLLNRVYWLEIICISIVNMVLTLNLKSSILPFREQCIRSLSREGVYRAELPHEQAKFTTKVFMRWRCKITFPSCQCSIAEAFSTYSTSAHTLFLVAPSLNQPILNNKKLQAQLPITPRIVQFSSAPVHFLT